MSDYVMLQGSQPSQAHVVSWRGSPGVGQLPTWPSPPCAGYWMSQGAPPQPVQGHWPSTSSPGGQVSQWAPVWNASMNTTIATVAFADGMIHQFMYF
jgi:hypothetical protein